MDQEPQQALPKGFSRREVLRLGVASAACACGGAAIYYLAGPIRLADSAGVFQGDAPSGELWEQWQKQGWAREARHYLRLGENIQCKLCPNECLLEPEDRGPLRGFVAPYPFKPARSIMYDMGKDMDVRVVPVDELPVHPDFGDFLHWHDVVPGL